MTRQFRQHRDEGLRSLYDTLIRAGKPRLEALRIVHAEQETKWGLTLETVTWICCRYGYYAREKRKPEES